METEKAKSKELKEAHAAKVTEVKAAKEAVKEAKSKLEAAHTAAEKSKDAFDVAKGLVGLACRICVYSHCVCCR